jgi:hypothetical protein
LRAGDRRRQHEGEESNRSDTDGTRFHAHFSEGKEWSGKGSANSVKT